jgi:uridine kinase
MPRSLSPNDQCFLNALWWRTRQNQEALFELTERCSITTALSLGVSDLRSRLRDRLRAFETILPHRQQGDPLTSTETVSPFFVWSCAFAIAQWICQEKLRLVAIAGPAGAGKSTLAHLIKVCTENLVPESNTVCVSLDDFHLSKAERRRRGIKWRATPGSHDIHAGSELLNRLRRGDADVRVPRYRSSIDDIATYDVVRLPATLVIFEGWFVGKSDQGYEALSEHIDALLYLDCPMELAKQRRFARAYARLAGHDAETCAKMRKNIDAFWYEVLEPGFAQWVRPIKQLADVILKIDLNGDVEDCDIGNYMTKRRAPPDPIK